MTTPGTPDWLSAFTVPAEPTGAVLALDFGDTGVWMARVTGALTVQQVVAEPRIVPAVLDLRVAAELRDTGRVPEAADPEVFDELVEVAARARHTIGDRDSALVMGTRTLRLVPVSRDLMIEATVPEVNRLHGMINELAGPDPVDAVLLSPDAEGWPCLWESLSERGYSVLLPGDPFPETYGGDNRPTDLLDRVEAAPASLAWGAALDDSGPVSFSASGIDPADYGLDAKGNVVYDAAEPSDARLAPATGPGDTYDEEAAAAASKKQRRRTAFAAAVLLALGGIGAAVATSVHEHPGPSVNTGDTVSETDANTPTDTSGPAHIPAAADRNEVAAARSPMVRYTSPTPPPPPKRTTTDRQTQRPPEPTIGPRPHPRPRPRTIPNPIPGLPPIVIG